ncbi:MAG: Na/Pi symporter [Campylobacter sp.]|nr:Na/Pi symporter [Campylobacter sp.]
MKKIILALCIVGIVYLIFKNESAMKIVFGLSFFLYAMNIMEESFAMLAGGRLETFLRKTTDKNYKSLLFGLISTSIMQSSGLVSLLAISFVGAGLITLGGGIGIIYGSNLGATVGIWLLAAFGFSFDIAKFAMPFIIFGIFMAFSKTKTIKGSGMLILSIGLIFFGIAFMKEGFEAIKQTINLADYAMPGYLGAITYALIAVVITALLQSSHATLILTLSALATGQINFENAAAIAIGSNVGSTVTAVLGSINASINGKKLTMAHVIFNLSLAFVSITFLWQFIDLINFISGLMGVKADDYLQKLAILHFTANLLGICVFYFLIGYMEKLLNEKIKFKAKKEHISTPNYLNEEVIASIEASKLALANENMHLFRNALSIVTKSLHFSTNDITSGLNPVEVISKRTTLNEIDFDKLYITRFKPLYNEIVNFAMRVELSHANDNDPKAFANVRRIAMECAEILKDMKSIEPNFYKYLQSNNDYIRGEYNNLRLQMLILLRMIFNIKDSKEVFKISKALSSEIHEFDVLSSKKVNELLSKNQITPAMATSLMNDSHLLQDIMRNIYKIARIVTIYDRANSLDLSIFQTIK